MPKFHHYYPINGESVVYAPLSEEDINSYFFEYYNIISLEISYIHHKIDRVSIIYKTHASSTLIKHKSVTRFGRFTDLGELSAAERRQLNEIDEHLRKKYVPVDNNRRWRYTKSARH